MYLFLLLSFPPPRKARVMRPARYPESIEPLKNDVWKIEKQISVRSW